MVFMVFGGKDLISEVVEMIWPIFYLQIQDGRQFNTKKPNFLQIIVEPSC
jgi:hypothetical protein